MIFLKCIFTTYHHIKTQEITEITELELLNENEQNRQNVISYRHLKKFENISCEEISSNCNLLIFHILIKKQVHRH